MVLCLLIMQQTSTKVNSLNPSSGRRVFIAIHQPHYNWIQHSHYITLQCTKNNTHSVLMAILPGEPGLAGCSLNSPSPYIPGLHILLGQA